MAPIWFNSWSTFSSHWGGYYDPFGNYSSGWPNNTDKHCGIAVLFVTIHQKPHEEDIIMWMILSTLLAILGGTIGGLIVFGGVLIYLLIYMI